MLTETLRNLQTNSDLNTDRSLNSSRYGVASDSTWYEDLVSYPSSTWRATSSDSSWEITERSSYQSQVTTADAGNTPATATDMGVLQSTQTYSDSVSRSDSSDYYRFSLTNTSTVSLSLTGIQAYADVDIKLFGDSNGNNAIDQGEEIARSVLGVGASESITANGLAVGTYFIQVYQYSGSTSYTLSASASESTSPTRYSSVYGYGLVNAAAAVAQAVNQSPFAEVTDLGGNDWNLDQINAPEVWAQGYTGQGVVVAVIDTGVDYTHPDLDTNIWTNSDEIAGNGIDDDNNGYIDDVQGWDFVQSDSDPMDIDGHGTHVAGTISAENNGTGTTGVAYSSQIMAVRVLDDEGSGTSTNVAAGIRYAADNGADIINLSLGGSYSSDIAEAVQYAIDLGSLVVMASGNESASQSGFPSTLADDESGIAVGAVNQSGTLASFSNRSGASTLNYVVAPGVSITSTSPGNTYQNLSGTSMATPHVSGVAALILSANPNLTSAQVVSLLTTTAEPLSTTA